jgi:hypothetical protein
LNHLAYGFLLGVPYKSMEGGPTSESPSWASLRKLVTRFGVCRGVGESDSDYKARLEDQTARLEDWISKAKGTSKAA